MSGTPTARQELNKTKEQLEEEKRISLSFRIKPLDVTGLSAEVLKKKAQELWEQIVRLETEKYDLEERQKRQDYDVSTNLIKKIGFKNNSSEIKDHLTYLHGKNSRTWKLCL